MFECAFRPRLSLRWLWPNPEFQDFRRISLRHFDRVAAMGRAGRKVEVQALAGRRWFYFQVVVLTIN